jgi:carbon monoxide dehydrogenase subunit G
MGSTPRYESRIAVVKVEAAKIYRFVTDMRNFERFITVSAIKNWNATVSECSFEISPVGRAELEIEKREENSMVKYKGNGLNGTTFFMWVQIKELNPGDSRVKLTIEAELNPVLRMMAEKPIKDFLEKIVAGIESFQDWDSTIE